MPFGTLDSTFYKSIPSDIHRVHGWMDNFAVTHSYGLFRRFVTFIFNVWRNVSTVGNEVNSMQMRSIKKHCIM